MSEKTPGESQEQSEREALSSQEETSEIPVRPRRRFRPLVVISVIILIGLIIAGGVFTSHQLTGTGGLLGPTPTATVTPGSNRFYFAVAPSWSTISVDGRLLRPIPTPNTGVLPLTLSPGTHEVIWTAHPFPTVHCLISLPFRYSQQNCQSDYTIQRFALPHSQNVMASLISFSASLNDLSADQYTTITNQVQILLNRLQGTAVVQPHEHFFLSPTNNAMPARSTIATVTAPLQAALGFQLNMSFQSYGTAGLCSSGGLIDQPDVCANDGQSCFSFCLFSLPGDGNADNQWHVLAPFIASWTYIRTDGQLVAQYQYDPNTNGTWTDFLVALTVSWTGTNWQVALDHSTSIERTTIANPVCDAAQYLFADDARFNSVAGSSQSIYWKFVSGANPAQGCVAEAFAETPAGTLSPHPLASCLYRFDVPLALDNEAHRSWPFLLQASPYEQQVAQQILAQAHAQ